jgi:hypothetical protein
VQTLGQGSRQSLEWVGVPRHRAAVAPALGEETKGGSIEYQAAVFRTLEPLEVKFEIEV